MRPKTDRPWSQIEGCTAAETMIRVKKLAAELGLVSPCTVRNATPEELAALEKEITWR